MCHPDGEAATARAAAAVGTVMTLSTIATATPAEVAEAAPGGTRWFQLYCFEDDGVTRALVDQAVEHGYSALVLTVDAPRAGRRERDLRTGFQVPAEITIPSVAAALGHPATLTIAEVFAMLDLTLTWRDLERIRGLSDLPLLVKGVLTEEDARLACDAGVDGIVVSNHGGRQLDGVAATIDALPEVVDAVEDGSRSSSTAGSAAARTWSRRWPSARAPRWSAGRCCGASPPAARTGPGTCSSSCATSSSWRSCCAAAPRPPM